MGGLIPQWFIDDLLLRADVVEVIDARVALKKAGHEYKACCPFHNEKTPSFTVSPAKQFYYCFGCGAHGTALGFLMAYEHMDYVEAIEYLAGQQGLEVPRERGVAIAPRPESGLYDLLEKAAAYYRQQLKTHPAAVAYLKKRGLSGEIAAEFGLGYAPLGTDNLQNALGGDRQADLVKAGMLIKHGDGRVQDRFRDRVMFPIRDRRGRVIGFGGRALGAREAAKYLNSPETPVFHKGRELYGYYEARKATRELSSFYVVEGYMDVIALAQNGARNVVATMGTATTAEHLRQLLKTAPQIVFCFDGDRAGRDAAWRALENALPVIRDGHVVKFLFLPEGEDPDSVIRQRDGKSAFERMASKADTLSQYFFAQLSMGLDLATYDGKSRLAALAAPLLKKIPGGVLHELMTGELAQRTGLDPQRLDRLPEFRQPSPLPRPRLARVTKKTPMRYLIALLIRNPEIAQNVKELANVRRLLVKGADLLGEILLFLQNHPEAKTATILEHWRGTDHGTNLNKLAYTELLLEGKNDGGMLAHEFESGVGRLFEEFSPTSPRQIAAKAAQGGGWTEAEKDILRNCAVPSRQQAGQHAEQFSPAGQATP